MTAHETIIALARNTVTIYSRNNGGPRRREGFRVAWHLFGADVDFRTTATRADHLRGLCDGWETRGAADRDEHAWVAANRAEARALAMHEASTGLAGLVDLGFAA